MIWDGKRNVQNNREKQEGDKWRPEHWSMFINGIEDTELLPHTMVAERLIESGARIVLREYLKSDKFKVDALVYARSIGWKPTKTTDELFLGPKKTMVESSLLPEPESVPDKMVVPQPHQEPQSPSDSTA